jgi:predicted solute-binding protein
VALGSGSSVPLAVVLGPASVPYVASAASPELALLAALAHGTREQETVRAAVSSLRTLDTRRASAYLDLMRYHLDGALDRALEAMMSVSESPHTSEYARK